MRIDCDGDGSDCPFLIHFEQCRDSRPNPDRISVRLRSIEEKLELVVGGPSVSASELKILKALWSEKYSTQKALALTLDMSTGGLSTIITGLAKRGLVVRKKPMAVLTKKGQEVVDKYELASKGLVQCA